jgi:hypothetical protein
MWLWIFLFVLCERGICMCVYIYMYIYTYINDDMSLDEKWNRNRVFDEKSKEITVDKKSLCGRHM